MNFVCNLAAPAEQVFRAFTHPVALRDWLCNAASVEARKGGHVFLRWEDGYYAVGTYTVFDPPNYLEFSWDGFLEPGLMEVRVTLTLQDSGVRLSLEYQGLGEGEHWVSTRTGLEMLWSAALENLESFLVDGIDLRLARRPRLGIFFDEFNAQIAEKMGLPVNEGVLLGGVADGSGAQAAGLQKDDVLVSLNGAPLVGPHSFSAALKGLKAGDSPLVEFFRGAEKHTVPLKLGSFPMPPLPESPAALAESTRQDAARVHRDISSVTAALSEDQAARKPEPGAWSVNEIICHFILTEREYQSWAADMLRDNEANEYLQFRPNVDERIAALAKRCGNRKALLDELALAQEETCALLENLPESFTKWRKHCYRRLVQWAQEVTPGHLDDEHLEQFKRTIAAVTAEV
jgi:uncharacterized protein YndB with AHSA1/START domain